MKKTTTPYQHVTDNVGYGRSPPRHPMARDVETFHVYAKRLLTIERNARSPGYFTHEFHIVHREIGENFSELESQIERLNFQGKLSRQLNDQNKLQMLCVVIKRRIEAAVQNVATLNGEERALPYKLIMKAVFEFIDSKLKVYMDHIRLLPEKCKLCEWDNSWWFTDQKKRQCLEGTLKRERGRISSARREEIKQSLGL